MLRRGLGLVTLVLAGLGHGGPSASAQTSVPSRTAFAHSISPVTALGATAAASPGVRRGAISRLALRPEESSASMTIEVALTMRDFAALQARIAAGEVIPRAEMERLYFPTAADHQRVIDWLTRQGLTVTRTDANRVAVFAQGSVAAIANAFQVTFARVAATDGEYTSAISAPSLPADVATAVLGIHGLQPHLHPRRLSAPARTANAASASTQYLPAQIAAAYNATNLGVTGAGQTIAIFAAAYPATSDLTTFWKAAGVSATTANIQQVNVAGGPAASPTVGSLEEACLDVEWASGLAPGATIRIYGANENDPALFDEIFQQVYADLPSQPNLHVFSVSFGGNELEVERDFLVIEAQYMANLASAGVTVLVASGDTGAYADGVLQTTYPTSDPDVTGVGGTSLQLSSSNTVTSETVWDNDSSDASGGGVSAFFARPSWQTGAGVPAGATRCVPDVAAAADPNYGATVVYQGKQVAIGGTSWSTPTWAAFCALINQSRVAAGKTPLGFLNPKLYPLVLTSAFRDITSGTNNYYSAGVGYDLSTGLGVPNVAALLAASLITPSAAPVLSLQTGNAATTAGQPATFFVAAAGAPTLAYQWQRAPSGSSAFSNLTDNGTYVGSATSLLVVNGTTSAMTGDQFQCVVSNGSGSVVSSPAASLTVNAVGVTTFAGWPGSGGSADGTGWAARFDAPGAVRLDSSGNAYVADSSNATIRRITPAGVVTTFAGSARVTGTADGAGSAARFNEPGGVATDSAGNVYVADSGNYTIRKITPAGMVTTLAGTGGAQGSVDGAGSAARFYDPENLTVDSVGNIYVADGAGDTIRKVTPAGVVTTLAGSANQAGSTNATGTAARFNDPTGIALDSVGNLYIADNGNNTVRKLTPAGVVTTLAGTAGRSGSTDGTATSARFYQPAGIGVDSAGNVWVADYGNGTVREISVAGVVTTAAGLAGTFENVNGLPLAARFEAPSDIGFDPAGNVYVSDPIDQTIRRIVPGMLPQFTSQPAAVTINAGQNASFTATATSSTAFTYQWQVLVSGGSSWANLTNSGTYAGATTATLTVVGATVALDGSQFQCVATNAAGAVASSAASLFVLGPPAISTTAQAQSAAAGGSVTLSVAAAGRSLTYQWLFNGAPLANSATVSGATTASLTLSKLTTANAGVYSVVVTNSYGTATTTVATLSILTARLTNLSSRALVGTGANNLIVGFVIGGTGSKQILLRGAGPALLNFGITGYLTNPVLTLNSAAGTVLAANTGWGGTSALSSLFTQVGAFPWSPTSSDSALALGSSSYPALAAGAYTASVAGVNGGTGVALAEIYDADTGTPTARLINISSRANVAPGANILIAGFTVGGAGSDKVLIRGIGPGLTAYGLTGVLAVPQLTLYDVNGNIIATNLNGWSNAPVLGAAPVAASASVQSASAAVMTSVGAFALTAGSNDTALLATLPAGSYTAQVAGIGNATGVSLIEVYEVPQ
jgi:sugar lactone lactonase YvrE